MDVHGEDDLALLAASFNQMAENLQRADHPAWRRCPVSNAGFTSDVLA